MPTYEPTEVAIVYGGSIISGFADDSMITLTPNSDISASKVGVKGDVTRVMLADKSVTITLSLMQSSSSNAVLSALANVASRTNADIDQLNFIVKDNSGTDLHTGIAYIQAWPEIGYSNDVETREWTLYSPNMGLFLGGNT